MLLSLPALVAAPLPLRADTAAPLQVAAFPLIDAVARAAQPRWAALQTGVPLQVVSRSYGDHHTAMATALTTASALPDVMALESSRLGRFARGGGLADLRAAPFEADALRARFTPFTIDQATAPDGALVGLPADIGPGTMLVRTDLLQRAGLAPEDLSPSWDHYVDAGLRLRQRTGAALVSHVQTLKDIVLRSGLQPGEGLYFDAQGRAALDTPRVRSAFALALRVRHAGLDARVRTWSNEWTEALRRGRLATELGGAWLVGQLSSWVAPQTAGLWRAQHFPGGGSASYGGTFYTVPRRLPPARQALAWRFMRLMCDDRAQQLAAFRQADAFPALRSAQDDAFFDEGLPFLGGQPARRLWVQAAARIAAPRVHRADGFADEVLDSALDRVLLRGVSIDLALEDAQRLLQRRARR